MKIFADTSNVDEIELLNDFSLIHGVTTNPTLMMKYQDQIGQNIQTMIEIG